MLRTSIMSGLILDALLFAYMVASSIVYTLRNWEASQTRATGHALAVHRRNQLLKNGVRYGLAGAIATYFALSWTKIG